MHRRATRGSPLRGFIGILGIQFVFRAFRAQQVCGSLQSFFRSPVSQGNFSR
jgi:hypothetical protein